MATVSARGVASLTHREPLLWLVAVVCFGLADPLTTAVGLNVEGTTEAGPVAKPLLREYGILGMVGLKALVLGGAFAAWRVLPEPQRVGIPLGLAAVGVAVTVWNTALLVIVLGS